MRKVVVVTGITGQDGTYLADLLVKKKYHVIGITRETLVKNFSNLNYFGITKKIKIIKGSLLDRNFISSLFLKYRPQEWYNLAGQSSVAFSWEEPRLTAEINFLAVLNQLEALRTYSPETKFFQASSAEIYGQAPGVITEKTNYFHPVNPYGVAKLAAHQSVINYRERYGLFAVNGILFNHESPLRTPNFATKSIIRGVVEVARKNLTTLTLGSLTKQRDFGFAGDFVDGMWRLLQVRRPTDAIFCTGETHSIGDFVREAFRVIGVKNWRNHVTRDPGLVRKGEIKTMRGNHGLLTELTGWKPHMRFEELVKAMIDYEYAQK